MAESIEVSAIVATLPDTLSLDEAAKMMRLGEDSMRELIVTGAVPAVSLNRKHCVLLREDVLAFLRATARQQADEKRGRIAAALDATPSSISRRGRKRIDLSISVSPEA